jgi:hypothetical protein
MALPPSCHCHSPCDPSVPCAVAQLRFDPTLAGAHLLKAVLRARAQAVHLHGLDGGTLVLDTARWVAVAGWQWDQWIEEVLAVILVPGTTWQWQWLRGSGCGSGCGVGGGSGGVAVGPVDRGGSCGHFGTRHDVAVAVAAWQWPFWMWLWLPWQWRGGSGTGG